MTNIEQLDKWLAGDSIHNDETDECCPDFSCCMPELLADKQSRQLFYGAYISKQHDIYEKMLMGFLANALPLMTTKKVYITNQGLSN